MSHDSTTISVLVIVESEGCVYGGSGGRIRFEDSGTCII